MKYFSSIRLDNFSGQPVMKGVDDVLGRLAESFVLAFLVHGMLLMLVLNMDRGTSKIEKVCLSYLSCHCILYYMLH